MLLQLAIGPMCLMVFNISTRYDFSYGLAFVVAVTLMDALYIVLACLGVATIINQPKVKRVFKYLGGAILIFFGLSTMADSFTVSFIDSAQLFAYNSIVDVFIQGLILTASNPLSIIFWSGMFTAQILENKWNKKQLAVFAIGCVMATVLFLTTVALAGSILSDFLPKFVIQIFNAFVGVVLIVFGIRLLCKSDGV